MKSIRQRKRDSTEVGQRVAAAGASRLIRAVGRSRLAVAGVVWIAILVVMAVIGRLFLSAAALEQNVDRRLLPPFSLDQGILGILGTDSLGRFYLVRLATAASTSLIVVISVVVLAALIGGLLGVIAGYTRGVVSWLIMRFADIMMAFPSMLLAVIVLYVFSSNLVVLILLLTLTQLPVFIRGANGETLRTRELLFVKAAEVSGLRSAQVIRRHLLRRAATTLWVVAVLNVGNVLLIESGLSFLGIGVQPPEASWGLLVAQGGPFLQSAWWLAVLPGAVIMLTTVAFRLIAEPIDAELEAQRS
jgi:peptide/nickel transport system permease protein